MSAKNLKFSAARAAWPRAWVTGSPVSNVSSSAIRAARTSMPSAILVRMRARSRAGRRGQEPPANASLAAVTARSISAGPPAATVAYGWLRTGSATSNVAPSALAAGTPPMKCSSLAGRPAGTVTSGRRPVGGQLLGEPGFVVGAAGLGEREQAVDALPGRDAGGDELLLAFLLARLGQDLRGQRGRQDQHPVGVADDDVAGLDRRPGAGHGDVGLPGNVPPAEDRRVDGRVVDRDVQPGQHRAVPDRAVGDHAGRAAHLGAQSQDVADRAAFGSPRASMMSTSPGRMPSIARRCAFIPPP